jgi:hypothetical protein
MENSVQFQDKHDAQPSLLSIGLKGEKKMNSIIIERDGKRPIDTRSR